MGSETARAKSLRSQGAATQSGRSTAGQGLGCGRQEAGRPVCRAPGAWLRTWLRRSGGVLLGCHMARCGLSKVLELGWEGRHCRRAGPSWVSVTDGHHEQ